jgi:hypothetical protein
MTIANCPVCGSLAEFIGNESETGKSWFACRVHMPHQIFSQKLAEPPRFGFQGRD